MSNGKVMMIFLIVRLIKKTLYKMSQYFPKPRELLEETLMSKLTYLIMEQKQI